MARMSDMYGYDMAEEAHTLGGARNGRRIGRGSAPVDNSRAMNWGNGVARPSRISAFSADGQGNFSRMESGPSTGGMPIQFGGIQAQVGSEYADMATRSRRAKAHNDDLRKSSVSAAMMQSQKNGGTLPANLVDSLTNGLGLDGRNQAVFRAGYTQDGNYAIDVAERGPNGQMTVRTETLTPEQQYGLIMDTAGVWGRDGVAATKSLYGRMRNTKGRSQMADPSAYGARLNQYYDGMSAKQDEETALKALKMIKDVVGHGGSAKDVIGNISDERTLELLGRGDMLYGRPNADDPEGALEVVEDPYERDQEGKTIMGADGKPKLKEGLVPMRDKNGRPMYKFSMDAAVENIQRLCEQQRAKSDGGDDFKKRALAVWDRMYGPKQTDPRMQEIQDRRLDNAVADQRRMDAMRGGQRLVYYFNEDGDVVSGNGYVRGGKVYDSQGYEIEGATPARQRRTENGARYFVPDESAQAAAQSAQPMQGRGLPPPGQLNGAAQPAVAAGLETAAAQAARRTLTPEQKAKAVEDAKAAVEMRKAARTKEEERRLKNGMESRKLPESPSAKREISQKAADRNAAYATKKRMEATMKGWARNEEMAKERGYANMSERDLEELEEELDGNRHMVAKN